jgi:hypothetical protein
LKVENQSTGTFQTKVKNAVSVNMLNYSDVQYLSNDQIGFNAKSKDKTVVALIVETTHIE